MLASCPPTYFPDNLVTPKSVYISIWSPLLVLSYSWTTQSFAMFFGPLHLWYVNSASTILYTSCESATTDPFPANTVLTQDNSWSMFMAPMKEDAQSICMMLSSNPALNTHAQPYSGILQDRNDFHSFAKYTSMNWVMNFLYATKESMAKVTYRALFIPGVGNHFS